MIPLLMNIVVFGLGGVVLNVALQGLILVLFGRGAGSATQVVLGSAAILVLVVPPVLAAVTLLSNTPSAGVASAFASALCVALLIVGSSLAVSALIARRTSSGPDSIPRTWGPSRYLSGLGVCVLIGVLGVGTAVFLT